MLWPRPGPLQRRGCRILTFLTVIFRDSGITHVIFKELLCYKFATPKERVSYPGVSDSNFGCFVLFLNTICFLVAQAFMPGKGDEMKLTSAKIGLVGLHAQ